MKTLLSILFIFSTLFYIGCNTCGENIDLGNIELMPESKQSWFPYSEKEQINFQNASGQVLTLTKIAYDERFMSRTTKWLCEKNSLDRAYEFAEFEELFVAFKGSINSFEVSLDISMSIFNLEYTTGSFENSTYDRVSYVLSLKEGESSTFETLILIAHDRGNNINTNADPYFDNNNFLEQIDLNGTVYNNVWYSDDEWTLNNYDNPVYVQ